MSWRSPFWLVRMAVVASAHCFCRSDSPGSALRTVAVKVRATVTGTNASMWRTHPRKYPAKILLGGGRKVLIEQSSHIQPQVAELLQHSLELPEQRALVGRSRTLLLIFH